jgi:hypothetical protein
MWSRETGWPGAYLNEPKGQQRHALIDEDGHAPHIEPAHVRSEDALPAHEAWRPSTALKWVRHRCCALMRM